MFFIQFWNATKVTHKNCSCLENVNYHLQYLECFTFSKFVQYISLSILHRNAARASRLASFAREMHVFIPARAFSNPPTPRTCILIAPGLRPRLGMRTFIDFSLTSFRRRAMRSFRMHLESFRSAPPLTRENT